MLLVEKTQLEKAKEERQQQLAKVDAQLSEVPRLYHSDHSIILTTPDVCHLPLLLLLLLLLLNVVVDVCSRSRCLQ